MDCLQASSRSVRHGRVMPMATPRPANLCRACFSNLRTFRAALAILTRGHVRAEGDAMRDCGRPATVSADRGGGRRCPPSVASPE